MIFFSFAHVTMGAGRGDKWYSRQGALILPYCNWPLGVSIIVSI